MNTIDKVCLMMELDPRAEGYYVITASITYLEAVSPQYERIERLTFTEACDVLLVTWDQNRPGDSPGRRTKLW